MVVAEDRVERLMVDEPRTTRLLDLPVSVRTTPVDVARDEAAARVDVAMLEVTVEPSLLVVVTAIVVGISVELCSCDDTADETADVADVSVEDAALSVEAAAVELSSVEDTASVVALVSAVVGSVV